MIREYESDKCLDCVGVANEFLYLESDDILEARKRYYSNVESGPHSDLTFSLDD